MASNENLNLIAASKYDIYSKLLYLAGKYTDVKNEDFLKSGLFGYVTESMAMILRDSSIHKTMLYNESFLNTAIIPKSIYNWARMFNVNINSAVPAYADINITISESDFESFSRNGSNYANKYGKQVSTTWNNEKLLIIDKSNNFIAGSYNFMLEHSIVIKKNSSNGYYAQYLDEEDEITTTFQTYKSPILNVRFSSDEYGENYITVSARVYQYKIQKVSKIIATGSFLDRKIHEFEFVDQFVGASCTYKKNDLVKPIELVYSNLSMEAKSEYYCFYSLLDENKLQLKFSDDSQSFKPAANSKLDVSIYTTKGANGNISYTGNVICRLNDELMRNLSLQITFASDKAVGGVNNPSLNEIKQKVINEISTRDVIVTETDLNNYFSVLKSMLQSINSGQVKFVKKRDDILRRIFTAYILFKNTAGEKDYVASDIQTNTVDVEAAISETGQSFKFGSRITYDATTNKYTLTESTTSDQDVSYISPFYVFVSLYPVRRVKYIYNLADESVPLSIQKGSTPIFGNSRAVMIPSNVEVYRGFSWDKGISNNYQFTFHFTTNFQFQNPRGKFSFTFAKEGLAGSLKTWTIDSSEIDYYNGGDEADANGLFYPSFTVSLPVDADEEFKFQASSGNESLDYGTTIKIKGERFNEDVIPILKMENITMESEIGSNFSMEVRADEPISLFKNLDDIMSSDVSLNTDSSGVATSYTIKSMPILSTNFTTSEENVKNFISQLFTYINMLKENLEKLETNTFFDLKFYNSYGISKYYNTHRTDLKLQLRVRLKEGLDPANYYEDIRQYVKALVDQSNDETSLKVSHIIAQTVANFYDVVESIDFEGLNDSFTQYIRPINFAETDAKKRIQLTPEHFGIPDENLKYIIVTDYENSGYGYGIDEENEF